MRSALIPLASLAFVLSLNPLAVAALTNPITDGSITVRLQPVATIPGANGTPQDVASAYDNTGRLFVATRNGLIRIIDSSDQLVATPFLNMEDPGGANLDVYTGGEGGLLGLAFSPNFSAPSNVAGSGKFYTYTTEPITQPADFTHPEIGAGGNNQIVIREWAVSGGNANLADPASSRVLMRINHPQSNHQGGGLRFGPDGNLYIAIGDGGSGNDNEGGAASNTDGHTNNLGNGQDKTVVLGKILRINPNALTVDTAQLLHATNNQYGIPTDNPFATNGGGVREIYAFGVRNPFRISFDGSTFYVGDVGQNNREEIDIVHNGDNLGWVFTEGTRDNSTDYGVSPPVGYTPIAPVGEYTHSDGDAVIGGVVFHSGTVSGLENMYVFGDLDGVGDTGRLFYMPAAGGTIRELQYDTSNGAIIPPDRLFGFGEGQDGSVYAFFSDGQVVRIVPEPATLMLMAGGITALMWRRRSPLR